MGREFFTNSGSAEPRRRKYLSPEEERLAKYQEMDPDTDDEWGITKEMWDRLNPQLGMPRVSHDEQKNQWRIEFPKTGFEFLRNKPIEDTGFSTVKIENVTYQVPVALMEQFNNFSRRRY